jgi:orotidine-5'-phosphate decarboxylase
VSAHFADRLSELTSARGPICAGIDPRQAQLPVGQGAAGWGAETAALLASGVAALKPQLAFFDDEWGPVEAVARAADGRCVVIADCKRGDIGSTAEAYARRLLGPDSPFDAITVNPYLGRDALAPFVDAAAENGKGLFVLVRTSNPGASDLQELTLESQEPVFERVARLVHAVGEPHRGRCGRSLVGAVVGLTAPPDQIRRLRELMPHAPFLMPGYGAQGGDPDAYRVALDSDGGGVLVSASRSLTLPWKGQAPDDWKQRVQGALAEMRGQLGLG